MGMSMVWFGLVWVEGWGRGRGFVRRVWFLMGLGVGDDGWCLMMIDGDWVDGYGGESTMSSFDLSILVYLVHPLTYTLLSYLTKRVLIIPFLTLFFRDRRLCG